jgi:hypothetical protein
VSGMAIGSAFANVPGRAPPGVSHEASPGGHAGRAGARTRGTGAREISTGTCAKEGHSTGNIESSSGASSHYASSADAEKSRLLGRGRKPALRQSQHIVSRHPVPLRKASTRNIPITISRKVGSESIPPERIPIRGSLSAHPGRLVGTGGNGAWATHCAALEHRTTFGRCPRPLVGCRGASPGDLLDARRPGCFAWGIFHVGGLSGGDRSFEGRVAAVLLAAASCPRETAGGAVDPAMAVVVVGWPRCISWGRMVAS